jgi:hypothetical protein
MPTHVKISIEPGIRELQVIKFTSCLPMVGGSFGVLRLLSQLKTGRHDTAEIWLKVALSTNKIILNKNKYNRIKGHGIQ